MAMAGGESLAGWRNITFGVAVGAQWLAVINAGWLKKCGFWRENSH